MAEDIKIDSESLRRFIPLNNLSDDGMAKLLPAVQLSSARKGDLLFERGDKERNHLYLLSGRLLLIDAEGDEESLQAGSVQAKFPVAHKFPRTVTAKASENLQYLKIDSDQVDKVQSPEGAAEKDSGIAGDSIIVEEAGEEEDDWMSQLLRSRVFQLIPPGNIQRVMMCMEQHAVKKGDVVIRQGEEGDYFYLINRGHCRIDRDMGDGKAPVELARLGPGSNFGEDALLAGNKRSATVTMLDDGLLLRLSKKNFVELIKESVTKPFGFKQAKAKVESGAAWLDVRDQTEFEKGHLQGAINIPFSHLRFKVNGLDHGTHYVVCCQDGRTSHAASYLLTSRGIQSTVLDKGLQMVPATEFSGAGDDSGLMTDTQLNDADASNVTKLKEVIERLQQQVARLEKEVLESEEKRVAEVSGMHDALEQARKEHSQVLTELLEFKRNIDEGGASTMELAQAKKEVVALQQTLAETQRELEEVRAEQGEGDEALREQVKGYLEEKQQLEEELQELRKLQKAGVKPGQTNRALEEEADRLRKELAQAEMALDAEINSRLEMEEELEQLKATIAH